MRRPRYFRVTTHQGIMAKLSNTKGDLLTTAAVSKWLRVSAKTVNRWAEDKEIPAVKVNGEWKFRENDLTNWVKKRTGAPKRKSAKK